MSFLIKYELKGEPRAVQVDAYNESDALCVLFVDKDFDGTLVIRSINSVG